MRWWLIRDAVLRQLFAVFIAVLLLTAFWTQVAKDRMVAIAVVGSMLATFTLGSLTAMATMTMREVRLRPVSRRAVWQATWLLSVIVAPLIVALGKVVGGFAIWMGNGSVAPYVSLASLSSLYDVLFGGVMLGALRLVRFMPAPRSRGIRRIVIELWPFVCLLFFFPGGWVLPVLAYQYLPHAWTAVTWSSAPLLIAAAAVGVAAWFGSAPPAQPGFARLQQMQRPRVIGSAPSKTASGWPVVAWLELRFLLIMAGLSLVLTMTMLVFDSTATVMNTLASIVRRLFDLRRPSDDFPLYFSAAVLVGAMATSNLLQPMLRQLRALPISRFRLTATLLLIPTVHVAAIWMALVLIYVVSQRQWPPILRLEIFGLTTGIAVFAQSLQLRFPARGLPLAAAFIAPGMIVGWRLFIGREAYDRDIAFFVAGATLTFAAIGVSLTLYCLRRAATYRPVLPFGLSGASAPR